MFENLFWRIIIRCLPFHAALACHFHINCFHFGFQDTATCFIDRLSDEYAAYIDVVQPVQVAVYEMKLGSSLILSSVFQKSFLSRVELDNVDLVMVFSTRFFHFRYLFF